MRLIFVRHGESEANTFGIISNRGLPHRLTDRGRQQAADLAGRLAGAGVRAVHTSPVPRAQQTAAILAEACGVATVSTDALREFDCGELEGRSDPEAWAAHRHLVEAWTIHADLDARAPGGESFIDLRNRFVPFIHTLLSGAKAAPGTAMVLVSHGGLLALMLPLVVANLSRDFIRAQGLPHASPVVVEDRPGGLVGREWSSTPLNV